MSVKNTERGWRKERSGSGRGKVKENTSMRTVRAIGGAYHYYRNS